MTLARAGAVPACRRCHLKGRFKSRMSFPPAIPAAPTDDREESYLTARTSHRTVLSGLLPFVWPAGRPDLRLRVVVAFAVLLLAKLVTVAVPIFFKDATDRLTAMAGGHLDVGDRRP